MRRPSPAAALIRFLAALGLLLLLLALACGINPIPTPGAGCGGGGGGGGARDAGGGGGGQDGFAFFDTGGGAADVGEPGLDVPGAPDVSAADDVPPAADVPAPDVVADAPAPDVAPDAADAVADAPDAPDAAADAPDAAACLCATDEDCAGLGSGFCAVARCVDCRQCVLLPRDCDDQDPATLDLCDEDARQCRHRPLSVPPCAADADCADGADCTVDRCQPDGTCAWEAGTGACDDGDPCTAGEVCGAVADARVAVCGRGEPVSCEGGGYCHPESGACVLAGPPCPNGQADCPPPVGCLEYECDVTVAVPECRPLARTGRCDDGDRCTTCDRCVGGLCWGDRPLDCDDGDPTTVDRCDPDDGCVHTPVPVPCATAADCGDFAPDACRTAECLGGWCEALAAPNGTPCEDGLFCTVLDECRGGVCLSGLPRDCDDGNPATLERCDEDARACRYGAGPPCGTDCETGADCDDGDPCTDDACLPFVDPSVCVCALRPGCACDPDAADGGRAECDDGDPCNTDVCVPSADPQSPHDGYCAHSMATGSAAAGEGAR